MFIAFIMFVNILFHLSVFYIISKGNNKMWFMHWDIVFLCDFVTKQVFFFEPFTSLSFSLCESLWHSCLESPKEGENTPDMIKLPYTCIHSAVVLVYSYWHVKFYYILCIIYVFIQSDLQRRTMEAIKINKRAMICKCYNKSQVA